MPLGGRGARRRPPLGLQISVEEEPPALAASFLATTGSFHIGKAGGAKFKMTSGGTEDTSSGQRGATSSLPLAQLERSGELLGKGVSSHVEYAVWQSTQIALKVMAVQDQATRHQLLEELRTMFEVIGVEGHPHLVSSYGQCYSEGAVYLALEFMDAGSLADVLIRGGPFPERALARVASQALQGLAHLHSRKRVHRDVKPANILMNRRGEVKVADFGISKELEATMALCATQLGTTSYLSPERLAGKQYGFNADVWALGLVVGELALGRHVYPPPEGYVQMYEGVVKGAVPQLPRRSASLGGGGRAEGFSDELCDFVARCLTKEMAGRPSAAEMLQHPFLRQQVGEEEAGQVERAWLQAIDEIHAMAPSPSVLSENVAQQFVGYYYSLLNSASNRATLPTLFSPANSLLSLNGSGFQGQEAITQQLGALPQLPLEVGSLDFQRTGGGGADMLAHVRGSFGGVAFEHVLVIRAEGTSLVLANLLMR